MSTSRQVKIEWISGIEPHDSCYSWGTHFFSSIQHLQHEWVASPPWEITLGIVRKRFDNTAQNSVLQERSYVLLSLVVRFKHTSTELEGWHLGRGLLHLTNLLPLMLHHQLTVLWLLTKVLKWCSLQARAYRSHELFDTTQIRSESRQSSKSWEGESMSRESRTKISLELPWPASAPMPKIDDIFVSLEGPDVGWLQDIVTGRGLSRPTVRIPVFGVFKRIPEIEITSFILATISKVYIIRKYFQKYASHIYLITFVYLITQFQQPPK